MVAPNILNHKSQCKNELQKNPQPQMGTVFKQTSQTTNPKLQTTNHKLQLTITNHKSKTDMKKKKHKNISN